MSSDQTSKTRVLLVDDHPMVRHGLAALLNEESDLMVCGEAGDVATTLELLTLAEPDLAIIDISLHDRDGIELIKVIRAQRPQVRVLVLSMHDEAIYAERALRAGASGYVMKAEGAATMMTAIRRVLAGKIYTSDNVTERLLNQFATRSQGILGSASAVTQLTDRELQILRLLGNGVRIREIATQLCRSIKTIETHRVNIKKKLGIKSSAELLRYAIQHCRAEHL